MADANSDTENDQFQHDFIKVVTSVCSVVPAKWLNTEEKPVVALNLKYAEDSKLEGAFAKLFQDTIRNYADRCLFGILELLRDLNALFENI